jgi:hypothetical protein
MESLLNTDFNFEVELELALVLAVVFMTLLVIIYLRQKSRRRNKRIQQDYETLALAKEISCDTRNPTNLQEVGLPRLHIKQDGEKVIAAEVRTIIIFIIAILLVFAGIASYLFIQQSVGMGLAVTLFAIAGVIYLGQSIKKLKQSGKALLPLKQQIDEYERNFERMVSEIDKTVISTTKFLTVTSKYQKPLAELLQLAEKFASVVPQDSTLKRHFMTQLLAMAEEALGERPTDSTLKRHYDQLLDSKLVQMLEALADSSDIPQEVATESVVIEKPRLPEDSTLRRHFITELRFKVEERLGMPRPTDFNLRRHYESLVQALLEKELDQHYTG